MARSGHSDVRGAGINNASCNKRLAKSWIGPGNGKTAIGHLTDRRRTLLAIVGSSRTLIYQQWRIGSNSISVEYTHEDISQVAAVIFHVGNRKAAILKRSYAGCRGQVRNTIRACDINRRMRGIHERSVRIAEICVDARRAVFLCENDKP